MIRNLLRRISRLVVLSSLLVSSAQYSLLAQTPASAGSINVDRLIAQLEPEINRTLIEGKIPSATIALISGDKVIWAGAYGQSNLWARTPAVPSTVYLIGSTFKAMATVAMLQLMEQGKFKLDDRVNDYLSDFKIQGEDPAKPVTFRHLFTHVSGLPGDFGPIPVWGDSGIPSFEDYLGKSLKLAQPTMEKEVYSNMAFTLIGYLVQKLSGVPFKNIYRIIFLNRWRCTTPPSTRARIWMSDWRCHTFTMQTLARRLPQKDSKPSSGLLVWFMAQVWIRRIG